MEIIIFGLVLYIILLRVQLHSYKKINESLTRSAESLMDTATKQRDLIDRQTAYLSQIKNPILN